eukprot:scaffold19107_cov23-Tisochrysis_lutea.AAC.1
MDDADDRPSSTKVRPDSSRPLPFEALPPPGARPRCSQEKTVRKAHFPAARRPSESDASDV